MLDLGLGEIPPDDDEPIHLLYLTIGTNHRCYDVRPPIPKKDAHIVVERFFGILEGYFGRFSLQAMHQGAANYLSNLNWKGVNNKAVLYTFSQPISSLALHFLYNKAVRDKDPNYTQCHWWHVRQNEYIVTNMCYLKASHWNVHDQLGLKSERCPHCHYSWDDPRPESETLGARQGWEAPEWSLYRYKDILEGRMDHIDGDLVTIQNANQNGGDSSCENYRGPIIGIIGGYIALELPELEKDLADDLPLVFGPKKHEHMPLSLSLSVAIEMEFGVEIPWEKIKSFETLGRLAEYVRQNTDYIED
ncbi:hypothetical protein BDV41DRAFT_575794 [Aspergillus transmontanensis]|uniref:Uncharacterized protein n=1 Tax=Aspergillus transmontanensis TaxID=1034304 RepID=A0A5N6W1Z9_9EURO|nr:hypothetical protein BDV41DRAFT_575794 [Aspergillus transmontanensis]